MIQEKLFNDWGVWLSFSSGNKDQTNYGGSLIKIHTLTSWNDFGYLWNNSMLSKLDNFFPDPNTGKYQKFQFEGDTKKIESINFFKGKIQPTWQYPGNDSGGYFNFFIPKTEKETQNIYEAIVFMSLGNSSEFSKNLRGVRFVDTTKKLNQRFRVEIWMDYAAEDNYEILRAHGTELRQIISKFSTMDLSQQKEKIKFYNITKGDKPKPQKKQKIIQQ